jgi:bacterioferritin-associated ferredoxin
MNNSNPDRPDRNKDIICHCSGTARRQIRTLIEDGIDNPEIISRMTGAGAGCGACETALLELLDGCRRANTNSVDFPIS